MNTKLFDCKCRDRFRFCGVHLDEIKFAYESDLLTEVFSEVGGRDCFGPTEEGKLTINLKREAQKRSLAQFHHRQRGVEFSDFQGERPAYPRQNVW